MFAYHITTQNVDHDLEDLIDHYGLVRILDALSMLMHEKADHIRANYDSMSRDATMHQRASSQLATLAARFEAW